MSIIPVSRLLGPVVILSASEALESTLKRNGVVECSVLLSPFCKTVEASAFSFKTSVPELCKVRIIKLEELKSGMINDDNFHQMYVANSLDETATKLQRFLTPDTLFTEYDRNPHLLHLKFLELRNSKLIRHEHFNRPSTIIIAVCTEDEDPVGTSMILLEETVTTIKKKYASDTKFLFILALIFRISGNENDNVNTSDIAADLRNKFSLNNVHEIELEFPEYASQSNAGTLLKEVQMYNDKLIYFYGLNNAIKTAVLPTEKSLELLQAFAQNVLIPGIYKNIELISQEKCPDISSSLSSWPTSFLQRTKLKYLKTSKLADFFGNDKENCGTEEKKKFENNVDVLKGLADLLFMLGNYATSHRLYTILYERLHSEPKFVPYAANAKEMIGLCTLTMERKDNVTLAIDGLVICLNTYTVNGHVDLASTALLRYYDVFKESKYKERFYLAAINAFIGIKSISIPDSYGFILESCFWDILHNTHTQKLYKAALYAYLSAECYRKTKKYFLAWRCYTLLISLLRPRDYPLMSSEVYRGMGDCVYNMKYIKRSLEAYALSSKYDHSNYYQLLSSYSSAIKTLKKSENLDSYELPAFETPVILEDTLNVKIIIFSNNTGSNEKVTVSKVYNSMGHSANDSEKQIRYYCGLEDTLVFTFQVYNKLNVDVNISNLMLTACFNSKSNDEKGQIDEDLHVCHDSACHGYFNELLVGDVFLASKQTKVCSVNTRFTDIGKLKITGYHFMINDTSFPTQWTQETSKKKNNVFINSGAIVYVSSEAKSLSVFFGDIYKGLAYGEMREIKSTLINFSDENVVVDHINIDGSMFFVRNNIARKEAYGCCIDGQCSVYKDENIKRLPNQCECSYHHIDVRNDITAYKHNNDCSVRSINIAASSSINMNFVIWADASSNNYYKIIIKYRTLSVCFFSCLAIRSCVHDSNYIFKKSYACQVCTITYEIFVDINPSPALELLFSQKASYSDHMIIELNQCNMSPDLECPIRIILFSPYYVICKENIKGSYIESAQSTLWRIVKHDECGYDKRETLCYESMTFKNLKTYMLEKKLPVPSKTSIEIIASSVDIEEHPHLKSLDESYLLSIILCNLAYKLKNYDKFEHYNWLDDTAAEEILKLFYKKDIIAAVIWSNKTMSKLCTQRVSDIKFHAEDDRLNRVTLSKCQKSLSNKFSLQLKNMNWCPLNVTIDVNTNNVHDFNNGSFVLNVKFKIENYYLEDDISFLLFVDTLKNNRNLSSIRNFYWIGRSSVNGKLRPYQIEYQTFVAVFGIPGVYDINTWNLYFYPKLNYTFTEEDEIRINPDREYTQVPMSSLLVNIKDKSHAQEN